MAHQLASLVPVLTKRNVAIEKGLEESYWLTRSPVTISHSVHAISGMDSDMSPGERAGISRKLTSHQCERTQRMMSSLSLER